MLESGDNRREPVPTSGGKEMARGTSREDTLAVFRQDVRARSKRLPKISREAQKKQDHEPPMNAGLLFAP
jgi:hypothetical protein